MKHSDFKIGMAFVCGHKKWRYTDLGARTVIAVCLDDHPDDLSGYSGPPYAVAEWVFDEDDQDGCEPLEVPVMP